jgi:hypothetical protein
MMAVNLISLTNCQYTEYSLAENKWTPPPLPQCIHLSIHCIISPCAYQNFETGINERDRKYWTLEVGGLTLLFFCEANKDIVACVYLIAVRHRWRTFFWLVSKHHKLLTNKWCQPTSFLDRLVVLMRDMCCCTFLHTSSFLLYMWLFWQGYELEIRKKRYVPWHTLTFWSRISSKWYLRIQSIPQREHHTSPLQTSIHQRCLRKRILVYVENHTNRQRRLLEEHT